MELETCRDYTAGGPIPWTAIAKYVKILGIQDLESFTYYIRVLDQVFTEEKKNGKQVE